MSRSPAVEVPGGGQTCLGFSIRSAGWRSGREKLGGRELPRTVEQFADLVGRVPLKNLVRETTDLIERLCIEAALQLTRDNRASAAEMLGLSRQGLYAKLRRYGLSDDAELQISVGCARTWRSAPHMGERRLAESVTLA